MRKIQNVNFFQAAEPFALSPVACPLFPEVLEIRSRAAAHVEPGSAHRRRNQVPQLLSPLEQPLAKVVVSARLPRVKTLHSRGVIFAAHRLESEVVEDSQVGGESHQMTSDK